MKGMIFAAGLGSRLAPLTDRCPKALVEVGGEPVLMRAVRRVRDAGADRIVVNVHHHAAMVEEYLASHPAEGVEIAVSDERQRLLDTGGGVVAAAGLIGAAPDEPVILYNADIVTDFPLAEMTGEHVGSGADATLLVSPVRESSRGLLFDPSGRMAGWINRSTGETRCPVAPPAGTRPMAFGGVHVINGALIDEMARYGAEHDGVFSLTPFYTATCARRCYRGYIPQAPYRWADIGRPATLEEARKLFPCPEG